MYRILRRLVEKGTLKAAELLQQYQFGTLTHSHSSALALDKTVKAVPTLVQAGRMRDRQHEIVFKQEGETGCANSPSGHPTEKQEFDTRPPTLQATQQASHES
jgi:hypothetical protein